MKDVPLVNTFKRLMDIIDGTTYGQLNRLGKKVSTDGTVSRSPDLKRLVHIQQWKLCIKTHQKLFQLRSLDGVVYGNSLRRIPAFHGARHGLAVI